MAGTLYLVATPIGNLGDITFRAIETLKAVDLILCEDTRHTAKLMNHFQIHKPLLHYDEHNHVRVFPKTLQDLKNGKSIALVTDAGTPAISDPGSRLVDEALKAKITVIPIPGPSSVAAAVSVAGFKESGYVFLGFLPPRAGRAERLLRQALGLGKMAVVFESPFRVQDTLNLIEKIQPQARVHLSREMTKLHEEYVRGDIRTVRTQWQEGAQKGEVVLVIEPN